MKRKYSTEELVHLFDQKDWTTLWKIMQPMVKHAVKRCMQEGLDPYYVRDDLMQEAYLAAWEALPRWNAFESGLQTWLYQKVRSAVLDANRSKQSGMIGGRDSGQLVISMHGEAPDDDGGDDEQGVLAGPEASMVYADPPEGYGDPADEITDTVDDLLRIHIPPKYHAMLLHLCGAAGSHLDKQQAYAEAANTTRKAIERRLHYLRKLIKKNGGFLEKPANHVMTGQQTRRRAA